MLDRLGFRRLFLRLIFPAHGGCLRAVTRLPPLQSDSAGRELLQPLCFASGSTVRRAAALQSQKAAFLRGNLSSITIFGCTASNIRLWNGTRPQAAARSNATSTARLICSRSQTRCCWHEGC